MEKVQNQPQTTENQTVPQNQSTENSDNNNQPELNENKLDY
jgi:hypothetical protein